MFTLTLSILVVSILQTNNKELNRWEGCIAQFMQPVSLEEYGIAIDKIAIADKKR